jgi:hypothetical protein
MKILALSDEVVDFLYSPRIKDAYADVDLVLGCGDLPYFYLEFIVTLLDVPLYYVPGNHDQPAPTLDDGRLTPRAEGCISVDDRVLDVRAWKKPRPASLLLAGLGGCVRYNAEGFYQYTQAQMHQRLLKLTPMLLYTRARHQRAVDIFLSHAAPRGVHDQADLAHTGFDAFLRAMAWFKPRLWVHGHSHVYRRDSVTRSHYQATEVLNVYPYRLIEWPDA